jgi:preprotein translocase subunit SecF
LAAMLVIATASAVQHGLSPGERSLEGFAMATTVGAVLGKWSFSRLLDQSSRKPQRVLRP